MVEVEREDWLLVVKEGGLKEEGQWGTEGHLEGSGDRNVLCIVCINVNTLTLYYGLARWHLGGKLGKRYAGLLCTISYTSTGSHNDLKIKSSIIKQTHPPHSSAFHWEGEIVLMYLESSMDSLNTFNKCLLNQNAWYKMNHMSESSKELCLLNHQHPMFCPIHWSLLGDRLGQGHPMR